MNINLGGKSNNNKGSGIVGGLLLLVIATGLLWWNEGNNVRNIETVDQMKKEVIEISSSQVLPENDGKLVATNGDLVVTDEAVSDDTFVVSEKTPCLRRIVEMYQWEETENSDDDGTSYSYSQKWSEDILEISHSNSHQNPTVMPYSSKSFIANEVKIGEYKLSTEQKENLSTETECNITESALIEGYNLYGNYITNSSDINSPQIGDIRISWKYNNWDKASVLAVTAGDSFKDYLSKSNVTINRVDKGILSSADLIQNQENENNMMKWIFRALGAFMILMGYLTITGPLSRLTSKVPILGSLVGGTLGLISFLLAIIHASIIIIIAWFRYRPILSIVLIIVIIAAIILIKKIVKKNQPQE